MKAIENFGAWVLANWLLFGVVVGGSAGALIAINSPSTVSLDAKNWECTLAIPDGIGARCTEYHYKVRAR